MTSESASPQILDVRLGADVALAPFPNAVANCVYEVGFVDRVPTDWAKSAPFLIVGYTPDGLEVRMALEKLERAGYTAATAHPDAAPPVLETPAASAEGTRPLDTATSRLHWLGRNHFSTHTGTLGISAGELAFADGQWVGGALTLDFDTLACTDLAGTELHDVLIAHLKDHDFFDVDHFPAPTVRIDEVALLDDVAPGGLNTEVAATLTLKGVSKPVRFSMSSGFDADGRFGAQGSLVFDRTEWNVFYGSGKWFHRLGMHLVHDHIAVDVSLVAG